MIKTINSLCLAISAVYLMAAIVAPAAESQTPATQHTPTNPPAQLPTIVVTAQKEQTELQNLPASVTALPAKTLDEAQIQTVDQAAIYSPNTFINEFSARALSNPFFRGVGGSPANPAVSTFFDGVPQLNSYSSSIEFVDVEQVEFVRGPQGALFGRNTAGGLINITSRRPDFRWTGGAEAGYGSYNYRDVRARVSGPIFGGASREGATSAFEPGLALSLSGGYAARDGYTENVLTGKDIDSKEAEFGKAQLLYQISEQVEARFIISGEHDDDGDYALGDLDYIRAHPHEVARDFNNGYNRRDVIAPTLVLTYHGGAIDVSSISGGVWWNNHGLTDLDYTVASPGNFFLNGTRENMEEQQQFTQEFRVASNRDKPISLGDNAALSWQSGVFFFDQNYEQQTRNAFAPPLAFQSATSSADLDDLGVGVYGQGRVMFWEKLELAAGLRYDYESKDADMGSTFSFPTSAEDDFSEVSPQASLSYWLVPDHMVYGAVARGYKAGGFNPPPAGFPAPNGTQTYDTEHTWNYEIGYKARFMENKLQTGLALFYIDWSDLQLNQQYPLSGGQFFIANAGSAQSLGVEFEARYRPLAWWDLFASAGYTDAEFLSGSTAYNPNLNPPFGANQDVSGNQLPYTPEFTVNAGTQITVGLGHGVTGYVRGDVTVYGNYVYDASNAQGQDTYSLADFRVGLRGRHWFAELWVRNAFDTDYVPIAIPYGQLGAPSGYVGESGAPVTMGGRLGVTF